MQTLAVGSGVRTSRLRYRNERSIVLDGNVVVPGNVQNDDYHRTEAHRSSNYLQ